MRHTAKSNRLPFWLALVGALFLVPGIIWFAGAGERVSLADAPVLFKPLARISLDRVAEKTTSVGLAIPSTAVWRRSRKEWGEPDFVISAVDHEGGQAFCLSTMAVLVEVIDLAGKAVSLRPGRGPYGYSDSCETSSLRFQAKPGEQLTLRVTKDVRKSVFELPQADVVVVVDWFNMKDKLVGLDLEKASVVTPKPANRGHLKTGQWERVRTSHSFTLTARSGQA